MRRQQLVVIVVVLALCVPGPTRLARAEPTADQVLADIGLSADERQQVMNGEFVTTRLARVSESDLPVALIVFVVTTSPDTLARQIMTGDFITTDPQVQTYGRFGAPGSLADRARRVELLLERDEGDAQAAEGVERGHEMLYRACEAVEPPLASRPTRAT